MTSSFFFICPPIPASFVKREICVIPLVCLGQSRGGEACRSEARLTNLQASVDPSSMIARWLESRQHYRQECAILTGRRLTAANQGKRSRRHRPPRSAGRRRSFAQLAGELGCPRRAAWEIRQCRLVAAGTGIPVHRDVADTDGSDYPLDAGKCRFPASPLLLGRSPSSCRRDDDARSGRENLQLLVNGTVRGMKASRGRIVVGQRSHYDNAKPDETRESDARGKSGSKRDRRTKSRSRLYGAVCVANPKTKLSTL